MISFVVLALSLMAQASTECRYGEFGCNKCIDDVTKSFAEKMSVDGKHRHRFTVQWHSGKSLNHNRPDRAHFLKDHIQSFARLSGVGDDNWGLFTRSSGHKGKSSIFLVRFDGIKSQGDAWKKSKRTSDRTSSFLHYKAAPEINHAGGVSALGGMVFIAGECSSDRDCKGRVDIYDARDPFQLTHISNLILDGSRGELIDDEGKPVTSKAAAVAATRLPDGKLLLFIGGSQSSRSGWIFVSDSGDISNKTQWRFLDYWHSKELASDEPWYGWENVNFIHECGTQQLYLATMGTLQNRLYLYQLEERRGQFHFKFVHGHRLDTGVLPNLRNGGGIHITPAGRITPYAIGRYGRSIDEFY